MIDGLIIMQAELESSCLEVVLVPSRRFTNHDGCIRVAANRNCEWYRQFCAAHSSSRIRKKVAHDTCIKRRDTARILARLVDGKGSRSKYAPELLQIAEKTAKRFGCCVGGRSA